MSQNDSRIINQFKQLEDLADERGRSSTITDDKKQGAGFLFTTCFYSTAITVCVLCSAAVAVAAAAAVCVLCSAAVFSI